MNRRTFLGSAAALPCLSDPFSASAAEHADRDEFGGWTGLRFESSGFFRLEKNKGKWWFVTPKGNAFLALGMNHLHPGWLAQPYNKAFWNKEFGAKKAYDDTWRKGVFKKVMNEMKLLGFNHFGVHNDQRMTIPSGYPFIHRISFVDIPHPKVATKEKFLDVFDKSFEKHCDDLARKECLPLHKNRQLIGYAMTDCPIFTDEEAAERDTTKYGSPRLATPTWPRVLRNLGTEAPGKRAYVETMRTVYSNWILHFNETYGTSFRSFDDLLKARDWRPKSDLSNALEMRDNRWFLERVVDRYYRVMTGAVRRQDSKHLVFGDKLNANTNGGEQVFKTTAKYTDLVFYQMYGRLQEQRPIVNRWSRATGKPCFNGDGAFGVPYDMMPNPHGPHCIDQQHRAEMVREFVHGMFSRNDFVGWSVCGWVDTWKTMPRKRFKQHSGFQDPFGRLNQPYIDELARLSKDLYRIAAR